MNKIYGYVVGVVGLALLVLNIGPLKGKLAIPFLSTINPTYIMIAGFALILLSVFMLYKKGSRQSAEVPIYHGKNVVGFRKVK